MIREQIILKAIEAISERDSKQIKDVELSEIIYVLAEWNLSIATILAHNQQKQKNGH